MRIHHLSRIAALFAAAGMTVTGLAGSSYAETGSVSEQAGATAAPSTDYWFYDQCLKTGQVLNGDYVDSWLDREGNNLTLLCGGLRHIKESHGYNIDMPRCAKKILDNSTRQTSNADPNHWAYVYAINTNEIINANVIVNKADNTVVTVYTNPNVGGSGTGDWSNCAPIAQAPQ